jgi:hypothetical protein
MPGTLHETQYIFIVTPRLVLLRMRNVADQISTENQNTFDVLYLFKENPTFYEILWKHAV